MSHREGQQGARSGAAQLEDAAKAGREWTGHLRDCFEEALPRLCDPPRKLHARLGRHLRVALQFYLNPPSRICVWDLQGLSKWRDPEVVNKLKLRVDIAVPPFHRISPVLVSRSILQPSASNSRPLISYP